MKLWPLASSTVVSARLTVRAGIVTLAVELSGTDTSPLVLSWLTSGRMRMHYMFGVDDGRGDVERHAEMS